ncbi:MAG: tetratricopeptide repeat protein [Aureliella sp.]
MALFCCVTTSSILAQSESQIVERYEQILVKQPKYGTAFDRVFEYHRANESTESFLQSLDTIAEETWRRSLLRGMIEFRRGETENARTSFEKAAANFGGQPQPYQALIALYLAQAYESSNQPEKAIEAYKHALEEASTKSQRLEICTSLTDLLSQQRRDTEALEIWNDLETYFEDDPSVLEIIATKLLDNGQLDEAKTRFLSVAANAPTLQKKVDAEFRVAEIDLEMGDTKASLTRLKSLAKRVHSESWLGERVRTAIETAYIENRDFEGLKQYFADWIEDNPDDAAAVIRSAKLLRNQGSLEQATSMLLDARKRLPSNATIIEALVQLYDTAGESQLAIDTLRQLVTLEPNNPDYLQRLGLFVAADREADLQQRIEEAESIWRRMIRHKGDASAILRVADLLRKFNAADRVVALAKEAIEATPEDPAARFYLANAYLQSGSKDQAVQVWREIEALDLPTSEHLMQLGEVYKDQGFFDDCIRVMTIACENANNSQSRLRLASIMTEAGYFLPAIQQLKIAEASALNVRDKCSIWNQLGETCDAAKSLPRELSRTKALLRQIQRKTESAPADERGPLIRQTAEARCKLAILQLASGNDSEAAFSMTLAAEANPEERYYLELASEYQEQAGQLGDAIRLLEEIAKRDRASRSSTLRRLANLQLQLGYREVSLTTAEQLLDSNSASVEDYRYVAELCFRSGDESRGLRVLKRSAELHRDDPECLLALIDRFEKRFEGAEAIEYSWRLFDLALKNQRDYESQITAVKRLTQIYLTFRSFGSFLGELDKQLQFRGTPEQRILLASTAYQVAGFNYTALKRLKELDTGERTPPLILKRLRDLALAEDMFELAGSYVGRIRNSQSGSALLADLDASASSVPTNLGQSMTKIGPPDAAALVSETIERVNRSLKKPNFLQATETLDSELAAQPTNWELLAHRIYLERILEGPRVDELCDRLLSMDIPFDTRSSQSRPPAALSSASASTGSVKDPLSINSSSRSNWYQRSATIERSLLTAKSLTNILKSSRGFQPTFGRNTPRLSLPNLVCFGDAITVATTLRSEDAPTSSQVGKWVQDRDFDALWSEAIRIPYRYYPSSPLLYDFARRVVDSARTDSVSSQDPRPFASGSQITARAVFLAILAYLGDRDAARILFDADFEARFKATNRNNPRSHLIKEEHLSLLIELASEDLGIAYDPAKLIWLLEELRTAGLGTTEIRQLIRQCDATPAEWIATATMSQETNSKEICFTRALDLIESQGLSLTEMGPSASLLILSMMQNNPIHFWGSDFQNPPNQTTNESRHLSQIPPNEVPPTPWVERLLQAQIAYIENCSTEDLEYVDLSSLASKFVPVAQIVLPGAAPIATRPQGFGTTFGSPLTNPRRNLQPRKQTLSGPTSSNLVPPQLMALLSGARFRANTQSLLQLEQVLAKLESSENDETKAESENEVKLARRQSFIDVIRSYLLWDSNQRDEAIQKLVDIDSRATLGQAPRVLIAQMQTEHQLFASALETVNHLKAYTSTSMLALHQKRLQLASLIGDKETATDAATKLFSMRLDRKTTSTVLETLQAMKIDELAEALARRTSSTTPKPKQSLLQQMNGSLANGEPEKATMFAKAIIRQTDSQNNIARMLKLPADGSIQVANQRFLRLSTSGQIYQRISDRESAFQILRQMDKLEPFTEETQSLLQQNPDSRQLQYLLAECHWHLGNRKQTMELLVGAFREHGLPKKVPPTSVVLSVQKYGTKEDVISLLVDAIRQSPGSAEMLAERSIAAIITDSDAWTQVGETLASLPVQPDLSSESAIRQLTEGLISEKQGALAKNLVKAQFEDRGAKSLHYLNYDVIYQEADSKSQTQPLFAAADPNLGKWCLDLIEERLGSSRLLPALNSQSYSSTTPRFLRRLMQVLPQAGNDWIELRQQLFDKPQSSLSAAESTLLSAILCSEQQPDKALAVLDQACFDSEAVTNMGIDQAWELYAWLATDFQTGFASADRVLGGVVNLNATISQNGLGSSLLGFIARCSCQDNRPKDANRLLTLWTRSQTSAASSIQHFGNHSTARTNRHEQAATFMIDHKQPAYALQLFSGMITGVPARSSNQVQPASAHDPIFGSELIQKYLAEAVCDPSESKALSVMTDVAIASSSNRSDAPLVVTPRLTRSLQEDRLRPMLNAIRNVDFGNASLQGLLLIGILAKQAQDQSTLEAAANEFARRAKQFATELPDPAESKYQLALLQRGLCFFLDELKRSEDFPEPLLTALDLLTLTDRPAAITAAQQHRIIISTLRYLENAEATATIVSVLNRTMQRVEPDSEDAVRTALDLAIEAARYGELDLSMKTAVDALRYGPHGTQLDANVAEAFSSPPGLQSFQRLSTGSTSFGRTRSANAGITQRFRVSKSLGVLIDEWRQAGTTATQLTDALTQIVLPSEKTSSIEPYLEVGLGGGARLILDDLAKVEAKSEDKNLYRKSAAEELLIAAQQTDSLGALLNKISKRQSSSMDRSAKLRADAILLAAELFEIQIPEDAAPSEINQLAEKLRKLVLSDAQLSMAVQIAFRKASNKIDLLFNLDFFKQLQAQTLRTELPLQRVLHRKLQQAIENGNLKLVDEYVKLFESIYAYRKISRPQRLTTIYQSVVELAEIYEQAEIAEQYRTKLSAL